MKVTKTLLLTGLTGAFLAFANGALGAGADIKYSGLAGSILHFGPVTPAPPNNFVTHAYILGSNTCNVGDASLSWVNAGTPALMMNAYRLSNGRLVQIGTGNAKTACCVGNSSNALCGPSCSGSGFGLRPGCMDTYSASFNQSQPKLAPRRAMNPQTGVVGAFSGTSGDAIYRRLQIRQDDMNAMTYPGALYFVEGHYVCTEDAAANNDFNNASYARVALDASYNMTAQSSLSIGNPAIFAWRDNDPEVTVVPVDVFGLPAEGGNCRFLVAYKVTPNSKTSWHYEYAVQNLTSARGAGSFSVPMPAGAAVSNLGFHDAWYHDDDAIYNGTDWTNPESSYEVKWACTQSYAENTNANALRYGTLYNFWFDCDRPPTTGHVEFDLFAPPAVTPPATCFPQKVRVSVAAPAAIAPADVVRNGAVDVDDLVSVILGWGPCACNQNCAPDIVDNDVVDVDDLIAVITGWTTN